MLILVNVHERSWRDSHGSATEKLTDELHPRLACFGRRTGVLEVAASKSAEPPRETGKLEYIHTPCAGQQSYIAPGVRDCL